MTPPATHSECCSLCRQRIENLERDFDAQIVQWSRRVDELATRPVQISVKLSIPLILQAIFNRGRVEILLTCIEPAKQPNI